MRSRAPALPEPTQIVPVRPVLAATPTRRGRETWVHGGSDGTAGSGEAKNNTSWQWLTRDRGTSGASKISQTAKRKNNECCSEEEGDQVFCTSFRVWCDTKHQHPVSPARVGHPRDNSGMSTRSYRENGAWRLAMALRPIGCTPGDTELLRPVCSTQRYS